MPDISMCMGTGCPNKEKCYRFTATPNEYRQSYFMEVPFEDGKCDYYWGDNANIVWDQLTEILKPDKK
jgi:hypothetical protein